MNVKIFFAAKLEKLLKSSNLYSMWRWKNKSYAAPSPQSVKVAVLLRNAFPNATWVETGTYLGDTTKSLLRHASFVYSIEPELTLFKNAHLRFKKFKNVEILNGLSEEVFPQLLPSLTGTVNFWLDGHFSAGVTYRGPQDTPILDELRHIGTNLSKYDKVCIMVDDVRCFNQLLVEYSTYPSISQLADWAEALNLVWHIEHDIFIAKSSLHPKTR